jgi:hypothetical protein
MFRRAITLSTLTGSALDRDTVEEEVRSQPETFLEAHAGLNAEF